MSLKSQKTRKASILIIAAFFIAYSFSLILNPPTVNAATESIAIIREDCSLKSISTANCYNSLAAWEAGEQRNLVASDEIAVAQIEGPWANPDTTAVYITGWTTDSTHYIKIYTTPEARHSGKWDNTKYRLEVVDNYGLINNEDYVRIDGLQITTLSPTTNGRSIIYINGGNTTSDLRISNMVLKGHNDATYTQTGINIFASNVNVKLWNNIVYNIGILSGDYGIVIRSTTAYVYNNTVIGGQYGIRQNAGTVVVKNNITQSAKDGYYGTFDPSSDYNISDIDGDAPNATFTGGFATVTFADPANNDFHLASSDTAAKDQGTDLSSDTNLAFTTDIDGDTRSTPWDIGADEANGTTATPDTQAPTTPTSLSATAISSSQIDLSWTASTDNTGVSGYKVYRGGTLLATNANTTYSDTGLSSSTSYSYTVSAYDAASNESSQSTSASATTQAADTTAPAITSMQASNITASSATITWTTDESATSQVEYGTDTNYGTLTTLDSTLATSHSVTISGLAASTIYYFRVISKDSSGNEAVSTGGSFTTTAFSGNYWYIRPNGGSYGREDGTDWNNAFDGFPTTLNRGDTYYIAGGDYDMGTYEFDDPEDGTIKIIIKKANAADNSEVAGWQDSFATKQAVLTSTDTRAWLRVIRLTTGYYEFDGVTGAGQSEHGIKITYDKNTNYTLGMRLVTVAGVSVRGIIFKRIQFAGFPKSMGQYMSPSSEIINFSGGGTGPQWTFQYDYFKNFNVGLRVSLEESDDWLVENSYFEGHWGSTANPGPPEVYGHHADIIDILCADGLVVRHNVFNGIESSGGIVVHGKMTDWVCSSDNIEIYDNLFYGGNGSQLIGTATSVCSIGADNWKIYNNTVVDHSGKIYMPTRSDCGEYTGTYPATNWLVKNNLYYNVTGKNQEEGVAYDHNYWNIYGSLTIPDSATNSIKSSEPVTDLFYDYFSNDFRLGASSQAINTGIDLGKPYNIDIVGTLRPQGSAWDIGAYEYISTTPDTTPPSAISDLSATDITQTSANLVSWTSPGDDGSTGTATSYDIRYSTAPLASQTGSQATAWWTSATQATGEPTPSIAGTAESYTLVGLTPNTTYYAAIKTKDEANNESTISNIATFTTLPHNKNTGGTNNGGNSTNSGSTSTGSTSGGGGGSYYDTIPPAKPKDIKARGADKQITLTWENPKDSDFVRVKVLRIESQPSPEATASQACPTSQNDKNAEVVYEGAGDKYTDINLNNDSTYCYAIFAYDKKPNYSKVATVTAHPEEGVSPEQENTKTKKQESNGGCSRYSGISNLFGMKSDEANDISACEAAPVYSRGKKVEMGESGMNNYDKLKKQTNLPKIASTSKYSIAYFIEYGTPTTKRLGSGERAGVINSYYRAFNKLPQTKEEWSDIIKIANGRWPTQSSQTAETKAKEKFKEIYLREPDLGNPHDNAAVTIISYGLRPADRNLNSERAGITIFRAIFNLNPITALAWDMVRAIAYSGAVR